MISNQHGFEKINALKVARSHIKHYRYLFRRGMRKGLSMMGRKGSLRYEDLAQTPRPGPAAQQEEELKAWDSAHQVMAPTLPPEPS